MRFSWLRKELLRSFARAKRPSVAKVRREVVPETRHKSVSQGDMDYDPASQSIRTIQCSYIILRPRTSRKGGTHELKVRQLGGWSSWTQRTPVTPGARFPKENIERDLRWRNETCPQPEKENRPNLRRTMIRCGEEGARERLRPKWVEVDRCYSCAQELLDSLRAHLWDWAQGWVWRILQELWLFVFVYKNNKKK